MRWSYQPVYQPLFFDILTGKFQPFVHEIDEMEVLLHFRTKNNISNHGSHFRSCLSWDFTRAKKIIHNDDKRNGMIAYNWCIYLFLNHKFPNRQRSHFHLKFLWSGVVVDRFKKFFSQKIFFPPVVLYNYFYIIDIDICVISLQMRSLILILIEYRSMHVSGTNIRKWWWWLSLSCFLYTWIVSRGSGRRVCLSSAEVPRVGVLMRAALLWS